MALADFFAEGFESLGALCERTWHDRLQVVAEGRAATLWEPAAGLVDRSLRFAPAADAAPRDAETEVFPGCPLTFRLVELLQPSPLALERVVLRSFEVEHRPPAANVAERLWRAQFPGVGRWRPETPFQLAWHFALLALVRCEVQAIDQHWSLHRVVVSLAAREPDESLARAVDLAEAEPNPGREVPWPLADPADWNRLLKSALELELASELESIRHRQENYLRRELGRIDDYFDAYEAELAHREQRSRTGSTKLKAADRLAAARAERERRRRDQVRRHEIHVIPHFDALMLLAEPAWRARVSWVCPGREETTDALFVPRSRRWIPLAGAGGDGRPGG
jgi:hypothetical protein